MISVQMVLYICGHNDQVAAIGTELTPNQSGNGEGQDSPGVESVFLELGLVERWQVHGSIVYYNYQQNITKFHNYTNPKIRNMTSVPPSPLTNKLPHIIFCRSCSFFPEQSQLSHHILNIDIFTIKWMCPFCWIINFHDTDQYFKYYCYQQNATASGNGNGNGNEGIMVDQSQKEEQDVLVMVEVSYGMGDRFQNGGTDRRDQGVKEFMGDSGLIYGYLEVMAGQMRRKIGGNFSWNDFIRRKCLTKIQYAIWLADYFKQHLRKVKIIYFTQDETQKPILSQNFIKKAKIQKQKQILFFKKALQLRHSQKIIISCCALSSILISLVSARDCSQTTILNLQPLINPITLCPTSSSQYLKSFLNQTFSLHKLIQKQHEFSNAHEHHQYIQSNKANSISIIDPRLLDLGLKQIAKCIKTVVFINCIDIGVFCYNGKKQAKTYVNRYDKQGNNRRVWGKLVDKSTIKQYMIRKYMDKNRINQLGYDNPQKIKICELIADYITGWAKSTKSSKSSHKSQNSPQQLILSMTSIKNSQLRIFLSMPSSNPCSATYSTYLYSNIPTNRILAGKQQALSHSIINQQENQQENNKSQSQKLLAFNFLGLDSWFDCQCNFYGHEQEMDRQGSLGRVTSKQGVNGGKGDCQKIFL